MDDRGENHADLSAGDVVSFTWEQPFTPLYLTVTSPEAAAPGLRVEVRCDGEWADAAVVTRSTPHPDQTAAYRVGSEPIDGLRLVATAPCRLSQVEVY